MNISHIPNSLPIGVIRFVKMSTLQELWVKQIHSNLNDNQLKNADLIFNTDFEPHIQTVCYHIILRTAEFASHCGRTRIMLHNLAQGCLPYIKMFSGCHKKEDTNDEYVCKSLGGSDDSLCGEFPSQCFPSGSVTCMMGGNPTVTTRSQTKKTKANFFKKEKEKENTKKKKKKNSKIYEMVECKTYVKQYFNLTWTTSVLEYLDNVIRIYSTEFIKNLTQNISGELTAQMVRDQISELKKQSPYLSIIHSP